MRKTRTDTYSSWVNMKSRCLNPRATHYENYGGRGIRVCERWLRFANFLTDMGERPAGMTLDRINNNGNYEPGNCRWATVAEQNRNQRRPTGHVGGASLVALGQVKTLTEWSASTGLSVNALRKRIQRGASGDAVILGARPLRITEEQVAEIRALRKAGVRVCELAARFAVSRSYVSHIISGRNRSSGHAAGHPLSRPEAHRKEPSDQTAAETFHSSKRDRGTNGSPTPSIRDADEHLSRSRPAGVESARPREGGRRARVRRAPGTRATPCLALSASRGAEARAGRDAVQRELLRELVLARRSQGSPRPR